MNNVMHKIVPLVAAAMLSMGGTASAQQAALPAPSNALKTVAPNEAQPLPEVQTSGDVKYVTGGIPHGQLPAFRDARRDYPLNIEIYQREGGKNVFTADAQVQVVNAKSGAVVLDATTAGPYLWAKVPPGQYKILARLNDHLKESRVTVRGSGMSRAVVVFP